MLTFSHILIVFWSVALVRVLLSKTMTQRKFHILICLMFITGAGIKIAGYGTVGEAIEIFAFTVMLYRIWLCVVYRENTNKYLP